jgi:5-hydroxyisourate hydrolase-like protein (transthyretin family)
MRRWGVVLGVFAIAVIAFLVWRGARDEATERPPGPADAGSPQVAALTGTPEPRVARPPRSGAPASVTGTVRTVTTRPIAGVRVCALIDDTVASDEPPCTTTDAAGAYRLAAVPLSAFAITASVPRHAGQVQSLRPLDPGELRVEVDFVLRTGARVRGKVIDVRGAPISGARVSSGLTVITGTDGIFELWVEPDRAVLGVTADGFGSAHRSVTAPTDDVELVLQTASSIAGLVVDDATAEPVPGARVHAGGDAVLADDEGRFELDGLGRGRYVVQAQTPSGAGRTFEISVGLGEHVEGVVVRLRAAHQLSVRVRRVGGSVCADPDVELDNWGARTGSEWRDGELLRFDGVPPGRYVVTTSCGGDDRTVHPPIDVHADILFELTGRRRTTGRLHGTIDAAGRDGQPVRVWASGGRRSEDTEVAPDGSYAVALEPGSYQVRVGGESPETQAATVEIVAGRDTEYSARLPGDDHGRLVVTVVDRHGTPMPQMDVMLMRVGSQVSQAFEMTDGNGRVRVRLVPGAYEVSLHTLLDDGMDSTTITAQVVAGTERAASVVLPADGLQIRGVVVDGAGAPVEGAVVTVDSFGADDRRSRYAVSAADGRFALPRREHRRGVEVTALRPGGGASAPVRLLRDEPVRLVIEIPASVTGTVAMADGSKPTRFDIIVKNANERVTRTFLHSAGAFAVTNVPAGPIKLGAAINGIEVWTELTLASGQQRTGVAMTLPAVAAVTGRVVDAVARTPVEGVKLNLMCTRNGEPLAFNHADQRSDADGRFLIRELPPGPCAVEVFPPSNAWLRSNHTITIPERGTGDVGELAIARAAGR